MTITTKITNPRTAAVVVKGLGKKRGGRWQVRPDTSVPRDSSWCYFARVTKKNARHIAAQWRMGGCSCVVVSGQGQATKY